MKRQIILILMASFVTANLFSQEHTTGESEVMIKNFGAKKASLVKDHMQLTPQQDSLFWPLYEKYEIKRTELSRERSAIVHEYLKNADNISDEDAKKLVNQGVKMEIAFKKLQKSYFTKISNMIGPVKAAQFYQFENYLNHATNVSIQQRIPFIEVLEQRRAESIIKK